MSNYTVDDSTRPARAHRCDETCVCPAHETPLLYAPGTDQHACADPSCIYAHGVLLKMADLAALIEGRITYRKNFRLRLWDPGSLAEYESPSFTGDCYLLVKARVEDTYNPGREVDIMHRRRLYLRLPCTEKEAINAIFHELKGVEIHEASEWFRVDGVMLFNPHA